MPIVSDSKSENSFFFLYCFNKDYSFNIPLKVLKLSMIHVHEGHLEGSVLQIFYLGLRFHFMNFRKLNFKK